MKSLEMIGLLLILLPFAFVLWIIGGWSMVFQTLGCCGLIFVGFVALLLRGLKP